MLGVKPDSAVIAECLMRVSAGLSIGVGLLAWPTMPATPYWITVQLTIGGLWLAAAAALRVGWPLAVIATTVLGVVTVPLAAVILVLPLFFDPSGAVAVDLVGGVVRAALAVAIIALVWTPGSRRWYRYRRAGGPVEPRPRLTLTSWRDAWAPRGAGAVTDEDVRALRDYLAAGGRAAYPDSDLAAAALAEAAWRRFGRATRTQVTGFVAEVLAGPEAPARDVWPRAATELLLAGLRGRPASGIDPQVRRATSGVLLTALAPDRRADPTAGEEFLAAAASRADRGFPRRSRCCLAH